MSRNFTEADVDELYAVWQGKIREFGKADFEFGHIHPNTVAAFHKAEEAYNDYIEAVNAVQQTHPPGELT